MNVQWTVITWWTSPSQMSCSTRRQCAITAPTLGPHLRRHSTLRTRWRRQRPRPSQARTPPLTCSSQTVGGLDRVHSDRWDNHSRGDTSSNPLPFTGRWRAVLNMTSPVMTRITEVTVARLTYYIEANNIFNVFEKNPSNNNSKRDVIQNTLCKWVILSDCVSECVSDWLSDWVSDWVTAWVNVWVIDWVIEWVIEWCNHWWVSEWMNELISEL